MKIVFTFATMLQTQNTMKHLKIALGLALLTSFSLGGCKKDDHDHDHNENDKESPVITINKPSADVYEKGDTVWMDVLVNDNEELHKAEWFLIKLPTDTVYENHRHQHGKTIHIKDTYYLIPNEGGQDQSNYIFSVFAEDDNENTATKSHEFHVD